MRTATHLGIDRTILSLRHRLLVDFDRRGLFTTLGSGVHPDRKAVTDIVVNGIFYARLPKWDEVSGGELLRDIEPHEISRLFFGHCRMEPPWGRFYFAVDVSDVYSKKLQALQSYESAFSRSPSSLLEKYGAEDRFIGNLVNVEYAEAFRSRSPLLVEHPGVFLPSRFG